MRTIAASTWYSLSRKTSSCVLSFSSAVSFSWMVLILIRNSLLVKSSLKRKTSPSDTSFPLGSFTKTRVPICPFASDCSVRRNSLSSIPVAALYIYSIYNYKHGLFIIGRRSAVYIHTYIHELNRIIHTYIHTYMHAYIHT